MENGFLDKWKDKEHLNIISHNCVGARMYQQMNVPYGNPFVWSVIPQGDFKYLYDNYYNIDYNKVEVEKTEDHDDYRILIDGKVYVYYVHYRYEEEAEVPMKKFENGINVYYNKMDEYILDRYKARLDRMIGEPLFIVDDRDFYYHKNFNFTREDLEYYIDKENCVVVTYDKDITGKNVLYMPEKDTDTPDIAKIILEGLGIVNPVDIYKENKE